MNKHDTVHMNIVNFMALTTGDRSTKWAERKRLLESCSRSGVVQLVGHGINEDIVYRTFDDAAAFFDIAEDQKTSSIISSLSDWSYAAFGEDDSYIDRKGRKCLGTHKESLRADLSTPIVRLKDPDDGSAADPICLKRRAHLRTLHKKLRKLAKKTLRILVDELVLPQTDKDHVVTAHDGNEDTLDIVHYPYIPPEGLETPITELTTLTISLHESCSNLRNWRSDINDSQSYGSEFDGVFLQVGDILESLPNSPYRAVYYRMLEGSDRETLPGQLMVDFYLRPDIEEVDLIKQPSGQYRLALGLPSGEQEATDSSDKEEGEPSDYNGSSD